MPTWSEIQQSQKSDSEGYISRVSMLLMWQQWPLPPANGVRHITSDDEELRKALTALARSDQHKITASLETRTYWNHYLLKSRLSFYPVISLNSSETLYGLQFSDDLRFIRTVWGSRLRLPSYPVIRVWHHFLLTLVHPRLWRTIYSRRSSFFFLVAAASIFQDIIISPQQPLSGMYGRGPIDFTLTLKSKGILGVTEVNLTKALPKIYFNFRHSCQAGNGNTPMKKTTNGAS